MAVKQDSVLLIIINLILIPMFSICQKPSIDTLGFKKDFEKLLRKYRLYDRGYLITVSSVNQKGGQTAFVINNNYYDNALKLQKIKFENEINNLTSNDPHIYLPALNYIQQYIEELTEQSQYIKLIKTFKKSNNEVRGEIFNIIIESELPVVTQFLKDIVVDSTNRYANFRTLALKRFLSLKYEQNLDFYLSYLSPTSEPIIDQKFLTLIDGISSFDKNLTLQILNCKRAVQSCFNGNQYVYQIVVEEFWKRVLNSIHSNFSPEVINATYFFSFRPPKTKYYDFDFKRLSDWYQPK